MREVDYCSGASILFTKKDFEYLGGFDLNYTPAYYEDTDFCFSVRHILNKKVVYQPLSVLVHFEGISSGKKSNGSNTKSYQDINKIKFYNKWLSVLNIHYPFNKIHIAAKKYLPAKKVMIFDSYLPYFDRESGSNRIYQLILIIKKLGYHIIFIPKDKETPDPYYSLLIGAGIEILSQSLGIIKFKNDIRISAKFACIAWICRPGLNKKYQYLFKINKQLRWIYDTVDLHYIRLHRAMQLYPNDLKKLKKKYKYYKKLEVSLAKQANLTVCITSVEQNELYKQGISSTIVIPNIHNKKTFSNKGFTEREGIIFIGSYLHTPNIDAVKWLCQEIMPLVWKIIPNLKVTLLGNRPPEKVLSLKSKNIEITGYVNDVSSYFENAKIFTAPLRYGAGMKGKIGQSLEFALPIITTDIGAEGMDLIDEENVLIANDPEKFAQQIIRLYKDQKLWEKLHKNSSDALKPFTSEVVAETIQQILF